MSTVVAGVTVARTTLAAEKTELSLSLSDDSIAVGDTFTLTLSMKSGTDAPAVQINTLSVPGLEAFRQSGVSRQTQIQVINGVTAVVANSAYQLTAEQPGDFTIGPVTYQLTGTSTITSNSVVLHVAAKNNGLFGHVKNVKSDHTLTNRDTDNAPVGSWSALSRWHQEKMRDVLLWLLLVLSLGFSLFFYFKKDEDSQKQGEVNDELSGSESSAVTPGIQSTQEADSHASYEEIPAKVFSEKELENLTGKQLYVYTYERSKELLEKQETADSSPPDAVISALHQLLKMSAQAKFAPEDQDVRQRIINQAKEINHYYEQ